MKVENTEQKAVLIQEYGYEKILSRIKKVVILDKFEAVSKVTNKKTTCELLEFPFEGTKVRVIKLEDHSTHKITTIGVPRDIKTCKGGVAWSFGLEEPEYNPVMES